MDNALYDIPKLGFGFMRLPTKGAPTDIDMDRLTRMVDLFLERGYRYFDTAYPYHMGASEVALREALVKRHPREAYFVANKMPTFFVEKTEDYRRIFDEQLERTGLEYFDFYLLHNLSGPKIEATELLGGWDFIKGLKEKGQARHIGFSFHDTPERLEEILTRHPEAEFVQLQINFVDWEAHNVQARRCYEVARKHGKPVIIMEPIKGGSLVSMPQSVKAPLSEANPEASVPEWSLRFCRSLEGIMVILSGMSAPEHVDENTKIMSEFKPLDKKERQAVARAVDALNAIPIIPCTGCQYCMEGCPQNIRIPNLIDLLNEHIKFGVKGNYRGALGDMGLPSSCIKCGACQKVCPQHLEIPKYMAQIAEMFKDE